MPGTVLSTREGQHPGIKSSQELDRVPWDSQLNPLPGTTQGFMEGTNEQMHKGTRKLIVGGGQSDEGKRKRWTQVQQWGGAGGGPREQAVPAPRAQHVQGPHPCLAENREVGGEKTLLGRRGEQKREEGGLQES